MLMYDDIRASDYSNLAQRIYVYGQKTYIISE